METRITRLLSAKCLLLSRIGSTAAAPSTCAQDTAAPAMTLVVGETQAARRIAFVHEEIRVRPGVLALAYPRWIPGEHGPTGHIQQFAALRVRSGSTSLPWTRDPGDIYTIHLDVPANAVRIAVDFDTLPENTISDHRLLLAWNAVVLYPRGIDKRQLLIEPSILLPANWHQGSSLRVRGQTGNRLNFAPVSLERLMHPCSPANSFALCHWPRLGPRNWTSPGTARRRSTKRMTSHDSLSEILAPRS
jgi:predicted metalloprotease with PDZ domain